MFTEQFRPVTSPADNLRERPDLWPRRRDLPFLHHCGTDPREAEARSTSVR
jgi:hypothetical protein